MTLHLTPYDAWDPLRFYDHQPPCPPFFHGGFVSRFLHGLFLVVSVFSVSTSSNGLYTLGRLSVHPYFTFTTVVETTDPPTTTYNGSLRLSFTSPSYRFLIPLYFLCRVPGEKVFQTVTTPLSMNPFPLLLRFPHKIKKLNPSRLV